MVERTIAVVGSHNSGKTTIILKLVEELKKRNHNVAVVKYHHHEFDLDPKSKDSYHLRKSEANITLSITPSEVFRFQKISELPEVDQIIDDIPENVDTCLIESYPADKKTLPTIFVANKLEDLKDTLSRYSNITPIFITGRIVSTHKVNDIPKLANVPFVDIENIDDSHFNLLLRKK